MCDTYACTHTHSLSLTHTHTHSHTHSFIHSLTHPQETKRQEQAASQKETSGALAALREEIKTLSREHKEINDKSDAVCTFSKNVRISKNSPYSCVVS